MVKKHKHPTITILLTITLVLLLFSLVVSINYLLKKNENKIDLEKSNCSEIREWNCYRCKIDSHSIPCEEYDERLKESRHSSERGCRQEIVGYKCSEEIYFLP